MSHEAFGAARHNFYAVVHKALRACLSEALVASGRIDPHDDAEVAQLVSRVRSTCAFYRLHAAKEDRFIHTAMEARRPGSSLRTAEDHVEHAKALDRLEADATALESAMGAARGAAAEALHRDLALFAVEDFAHMHAEETENNAVLWACYSDAELAEIERELVASIPPAEKLAFIGVMSSACAPAERAVLLTGVRASAPPPVFERVIAAVKPRLSDAEWGKLALALAL
jgi:hypothetical protein